LDKRKKDETSLRFKARIVGGSDAFPGAYPWAAYLKFKNNTHHCGASIISEKYLLTAAHCFE